MFDQVNDQGQTQDDQNAFGNVIGGNLSVPAPGAPAGPITDDVAGPISDDQLGYAAASLATPQTTVEEPVVDNPVSEPAPQVAPVSDGASDELLNIKQDALHSLSPLVDQLEQTPEEKFRTTMMMIQASDDRNLIKPAYESAKQIEDEKVRAQALLDVVNEINYFTQQDKS